MFADETKRKASNTFVQILDRSKHIRSALARERGVQRTIQLPAVGARLRANTEGKSLCGVRPQADSYKREHGGEIVMPCSSASGLLQRERGGEIVTRCSSASGLLQARTRRENRYAVFVRKRTPTSANAAGKSLCGVRPQAASCRRCQGPQAPNHRAAFTSSRNACGHR